MKNNSKQKGFGIVRLIGIIVVVFVIVIVLIVIFGLKQQPEEGEEFFPEEEETEELFPEFQTPNPASVYCDEQGGYTEIRSLADGSQKGFCLFDDDSECEEWAFFREECKRGDNFCQDLCGDGICQEIVCLAIGCPCPETPETCPQDCQ